MKRNDDGFTLVELLLSVAILVIIMGAITGALITFLKNGTYASERDDHSGGAVVLSTYLNRDLASADTVTTGAASCSGSGTSVLNLQWTEWTASAANPSPAPTGGTWKTSYVVTNDTVAIGGAARYQLLRRLCPPTGGSTDSIILRNLDAQTPGVASSVMQVVVGSAPTTCPAGTVTVTLPSYLDDDTGKTYNYAGCVKGRTR